MRKKISIIFGLSLVLFFLISIISCKRENKFEAPKIELIFEAGYTKSGDTLEIGKAIKFKVKAEGVDANLTNFTIKKHYDGKEKTVLDTGLNSAAFLKTFTFYQSVEDRVEWVLSVMDRNRESSKVTIIVLKDPNSQFGGILEFSNIKLGYQDNTQFGHFFLPKLAKVYFGDSAALFQDKVDIAVYFNYREDFGQLKPSPTFSSPGEEISATGEMYDLYYPFLKNWNVRNYTKYDIRALNGITSELYNNAHNDSLLIVSYDDVWGKRKYKWAVAGTFIPFQTADGKKGIIRVDNADFSKQGTITFSMKIQM